MVAPVFTGNVNQLHYDGPGIILMAPYSATLTLPTFTSVSSAFTNTWDAAWQPVGYTDTGFEVDLATTTVDIDAAESIYPLATVETLKTINVKFTMMQDNQFNTLRAMNGGSYTTSGSSGAAVTKYTPPIVGGSLRSAIAWLSQGADQSWIGYKAFQSGNITVQRQKLGTKFLLACDFKLEVPDSSLSTSLWNSWYAGTAYN